MWKLPWGISHFVYLPDHALYLLLPIIKCDWLVKVIRRFTTHFIPLTLWSFHRACVNDQKVLWTMDKSPGPNTSATRSLLKSFWVSWLRRALSSLVSDSCQCVHQYIHTLTHMSTSCGRNRPSRSCYSGNDCRFGNVIVPMDKWYI